MWKNCKEIAGKSHEKDSLYKQTEARIEEICKNLEYKHIKMPVKNSSDYLMRSIR